MASAAYFTLAVCGEVYAPSALTIWTRNSIYETLVFPTAMVRSSVQWAPPSQPHLAPALLTPVSAM